MGDFIRVGEDGTGDVEARSAHHATMVHETHRTDWVFRGAEFGVRELCVLVSQCEFYSNAQGGGAGGDDVRDVYGGT